MEVRWSSPCRAGEEHEGTEAELVLSLDSGFTYPVRVSSEISPCAARFLWQVPSLSASHARLALRVGDGEDDEESEEIALVSEPFTILPDPDGRVEPMYPRASEWWTPQAPAALDADDLLKPILGKPEARFSGSAPGSEATEPTPRWQDRPLLASRPLPAVRTPFLAVESRALQSCPGALVPLRL